MISLIEKNCLASVLLLATAFIDSAKASTLVTDPARISFVGPYCKNLGLEQISIDAQNKLHIDLSSLAAGTREEPMKGCLIKIPYTLADSSLTATVTLRGTYQQGTEDRLTGVLRMAAAGELGRANILSLSESPSGKFEWQQPLLVSRSDQVEDVLKLSIFLKLETAKAIPPADKLQTALPIVQFKAEELIIDHVSAKPGFSTGL